MIRRTNIWDKRQIFMRGFWKQSVLLAEQIFLFFFFFLCSTKRPNKNSKFQWKLCKVWGWLWKNFAIKLLTTCVVEATISVTYSYFFFTSVQEVECEDHHQFPVPWCGWERGPQQFVWSGFGASRQQRGTSPPPNKSSYKVVLTSFFPVFKQAFVLWPGVFNLLPGLQQLSRTPGTRGAPSARVQPAVFRCEQLYAPHTQPNTLMFLTLFPLTGISNRATVSPPLSLSLCIFVQWH